ncbi:MAG: N-6 DNA methylase [Methanomicrobiales archaeon]
MSEETGVTEGVLKLIQRYEAFRQIYLKGEYNETQLRREFVDPLFRALGWDVDNNQGYSEAYKDVVHEQTIKFRGQDTNTKFIDYAFRLGGMMKFIVETKKPSSKIADDARSALQVRRYGWNAKLSLNILTNFEEWAIYDCRIKPENSDPATKGRIKYFTYKDIAKEWDYLSSVFTKSAIQKGSFDAYAIETKGKKGTASVDDTFLAEIEEWRDRLAKNLALRNPTLSVDELNDAVQKTIDRIIFLRICEDRGIEKYETLKNVLDGEGTYTKLCVLFLDADERYNSGLFHFSEEKGNPEMPDGYTLTLTIDDKVLKDLIKRLYYPDCPFEFSVLPTAILGHVYEQFLGKVIRLTEGHQAKVEYKPEVKKAGGVFYTPEYIVDYIVEHTVGELIKGRTPKEVSKIRVLDPACGSGSFLLGAYDKLLDWHRDWYIENLVPVLKEKGETSPEVKALVPPDARGAENLPVYKASNGTDSRVRSDWNLTTAERKRILLNNIYGVDIDRQAVEVTKLSLLLKVLEEENEETVSKQLKLFKERALPSLHENIKCGNSLIGSDIYKDVQVTLDDPTVAKRINAFDWDVEFPEIMAAGGFDAVIGNPPYIRIQTMKEWAPTEVEFYKKKFISASKGNYDIYVVFVEKGLMILNKNGLLGYILPHKFFNAQYGEALRAVISKGKHLKEIVHFGHQQVFENATTYTCLLFLGNKGYDEFLFDKVDDLNSWNSAHIKIEGTISIKDVTEKEWNFVVGNDAGLFKKLESIKFKLKDATAKIYQGLVTGADPVFIVVNQQDKSYLSEATQKKHFLEKELLHPLCKGALNIRRYYIDTITKSILFPYKIIDNKAILLTEKELAENYPNTWEYFKLNKSLLESRENGKWKHKQWYAFGRNQNLTEMDREKILTPSIANGACFTFDSKDYFYFMGSGGGGGGGYGITLIPEEKMSYYFLLGILNSKLSTFYIRKISSTFRGGYIALNRQYIEQLPIRTINFSDPADVTRHDKMVTLVERMLDLNKQLPEARTDQEQTFTQRRIAATDKEIDDLVYELYGLTEEERKIVEGI